MDEILLTPREIELETERAIAAWNDSRPEQVPSREEFVLAWGCRAQVRTVYDYMRTHWLQARQLDYHTAQDNTVQLTIKSEDWQALREAAGGEGK